MTEQIRAALLISGKGTTAESVIQKYQQGELEGITPVLVISSNPQAEGIIKTKKLGIKTEIIKRKDYLSDIDFGRQLLNTLESERIDLVAQLGWLPKTPLNVIKEYNHRIFNQHPAPLDPGREDFGGLGMCGKRTTLAVLLYNCLSGESIPTEATTHLVNDYYDKGEIISRRELKINNPFGILTREEIMSRPILQYYIFKTVTEIEDELRPIEHENVLFTLKSYLNNKPTIFIRETPLIPKDKLLYLSQAKKLAIDLTKKN